MGNTTRPLSDIRVIDCAQMLSGPFASQLLADLGAEVIKIERPGTGDITRSIEPTVCDSEMMGYFTSLNRGKRSVELDLSNAYGAAAFVKLVEIPTFSLKTTARGRWSSGDSVMRTFKNLMTI